MQKVLAGLDWCFDDIPIVSSTFEEHLEQLREVLRKAGLRLKPGKRHLLKRKVGHIISEEGVYPDPQKLRK